MMRPFVLTSTAVALIWLMPSRSSVAAEWELSVAAGKTSRTNVPVKAVISGAAAKEIAAAGIQLADAQGKQVVAQVTPAGLLGSADSYEIHWVAPRLAAGETAVYRAKLGGAESAATKSDGFSWRENAGESIDLRYGDRPVLRYMNQKLDESSKASREQTYKVYHHLYDPAGSTLVTKGPGSLYTHHRGIFYGFNKITYGGGKSTDTWHCTNGAHQSHEGVLAAVAGPVVGRHRVAIDWHGQQKEVFAKEERELTVYLVPGGQLVEFASRLKTAGGPVKLDGDPQHAGFQFRAAAEVAEKTKGDTYYLRPDGKGKLGETRNWNNKPDPQTTNLPWNALSFVVGGQRYTTVYLDKPTNPKEARFSERDYGRFGSYFVYELTADKPLEINYRLWLQAGEMNVEQAAALSADFVDPPRVTVAAK